MAERSGRRTFLGAIAALGGAAIGAIVGLPGIGYVLDPVLRRGSGAGRWFRVGRVENVPSELPVSVTIVGEARDAWTKAPRRRLGAVWLRKKSDGRVHALTAECPHLGCGIKLDEDARRFACPCHESAFTLDGRALGGPSPRGMDTLETRIHDGVVEVRFQRFRTQIKDKQPIG